MRVLDEELPITRIRLAKEEELKYVFDTLGIETTMPVYVGYISTDTVGAYQGVIDIKFGGVVSNKINVGPFVACGQ